MARNFTAQELVVLRAHLKAARNAPQGVDRIAYILPVLDALVDALGESGDLTLLARKSFEEAHGGTPG